MKEKFPGNAAEDLDAIAEEHAADRKARDRDGLSEDEQKRAERARPAYGAGSAGELPRHRKDRFETRAKITGAAQTIRELLDDPTRASPLDDPNSAEELKELLAALDLRRSVIQQEHVPFELDEQ